MERVGREPALDPRTHRGKGYDPVVYVATILFGFAAGAASMADLVMHVDIGKPM